MPPAEPGHRFRELELIDTQSGGDVSRIVIAGVGELPGATLHEQVRYLESEGDGLRRLLLNEPYGDPAMSVDLIVPPKRPEAAAGYIIMEAMGYPLYSGSNTICTATAVLESGRVPLREGTQEVVLESPAGLARITAVSDGTRVHSITTRGEPAYVSARDLTIDVAPYGTVRYDVVWSGAFFALVHADEHGFGITRDEQVALAAFGDAFVRAARPEFVEVHPDLGDVGPLPFVHFCGPVEQVADDGYRSRSATYVHPGVICRSPTGTGTSARMARMYERGQLGQGQWLETVSPRDTSFRGTVLGEAQVGPHAALDTHITGRAYTLAHSRIVVDLDDPLVDASDLEHLLTTAPALPTSGT